MSLQELSLFTDASHHFHHHHALVGGALVDVEEGQEGTDDDTSGSEVDESEGYGHFRPGIAPTSAQVAGLMHGIRGEWRGSPYALISLEGRAVVVLKALLPLGWERRVRQAWEGGVEDGVEDGESFGRVVFPGGGGSEEGGLGSAEGGGGEVEGEGGGKLAVFTMEELRGGGDWLIALFRSGRFAAAVYPVELKIAKGTASIERSLRSVCKVHRTSARYTVRRKQGGAQSTRDATGKRPKSMGSQLRRDGEERLLGDVHSTWEDWSEGGGDGGGGGEKKKRSVLEGVGRVWAGVGKHHWSMLFGSPDAPKLPPHLQVEKSPIAYGRPSFEATSFVAAALGRMWDVGSVEDVEEKIRQDEEDARLKLLRAEEAAAAVVEEGDEGGESERGGAIESHHAALIAALSSSADADEAVHSSTVVERLIEACLKGDETVASLCLYSLELESAHIARSTTSIARADSAPAPPPATTTPTTTPTTTETVGDSSRPLHFGRSATVADGRPRQNLHSLFTTPSEVKEKEEESGEEEGEEEEDWVDSGGAVGGGGGSGSGSGSGGLMRGRSSSVDVVSDRLLSLAAIPLFLRVIPEGCNAHGKNGIPPLFGLCPEVNLVRLSDGMTALHAAALAGSPELVRALLDRAADPTKKDFRGRSVYSRARGPARRVLREFRAEFPELWDWRASGVPREDGGTGGSGFGSTKEEEKEGGGGGEKRGGGRKKKSKKKKRRRKREKRVEEEEGDEGEEGGEGGGSRSPLLPSTPHTPSSSPLALPTTYTPSAKELAARARVMTRLQNEMMEVARRMGIPEHVLWMAVQGRGRHQGGAGDSSPEACEERAQAVRMLVDGGAPASDIFLALGWEEAAAVAVVGDGWADLQLLAEGEVETLFNAQRTASTTTEKEESGSGEDGSGVGEESTSEKPPSTPAPLTPEEKRKLVADAARRRASAKKRATREE